jgi:hypothetical protein
MLTGKWLHAAYAVRSPRKMGAAGLLLGMDRSRGWLDGPQALGSRGGLAAADTATTAQWPGCSEPAPQAALHAVRHEMTYDIR